ncbi:MAG TPA: protein kinase [Pirellulales bacterium]|jgi:hypothetical protein|nr:protein kinase [Pirellulales bacterium]
MPVTIARFIECLASTGALTADDLNAAEAAHPPASRTGDADQLARELVRQGKLTKFQAAAIYQDKAESLMLGNYLLLDKFGAGGMGQVYRARHRRMDRVVAIKVLPKKAVEGAGAVERFQREMKAAARLTHPNIVTAHDADEAGGIHFLVMEFVEGSDLSSLVKKQGPLAPSIALDCIRQAARGLAHAHEKGVVHRDIKPSNLLLDRQGTVKILDMGLARFSEAGTANQDAASQGELTVAGSIMGTVDYMAPEQAMDSRKADARADVYSLGCTLHYLLTGKPPYGGDTLVKRITAHQRSAVPLLSNACPGSPAELDKVFGKMLAKSPGQRFQTMAEVIAAIDAVGTPASGKASATAAIAARAPAPASDSNIREASSVMLPGLAIKKAAAAKRAGKKSPLPAVGAAAVLILLVGAGAAAWLLTGSSPSPPSAVAQATTEPSALPAPAVIPETTVPASPGEPERQPPAPAVTEPTVTEAAPAMTAVPTPQAENNSVADTAPMPEPVVSAPPAAAAAAAASTPTPSEPEQPPSSPQPVPPARLPVPAAAAQARADELVKEIFKDDLANAKTDAARGLVAGQMLLQAEGQAEDPAGRYVMIVNARDLAIDAGEPQMADRAVAMLAASFDVNLADGLVDALEKIVAKSRASAAYKPTAEWALLRGQEFAADEDWDAAGRFTKAALDASRKSRDVDLIKQATEQTKVVAAGKKQSDAVALAQQTLEKTPNDPVANLVVGRYLAFAKHDWSAGFEHLAKSSDAALKDLAAKGSAGASDAEGFVTAGDAWWDASDKAKPADKTDYRAAAAYWYAQAVENLTGLAKTRIEKRLAELGSAAPRTTKTGKPSSPATAATARVKLPPANGLIVPGVLDCSQQPHFLQVGSSFDSTKSWTLAFEFLLPTLTSDSRMIFYYGNKGGSKIPIHVQQLGNNTLKVRIFDANTSEVQLITVPLDGSMLGKWKSIIVRVDTAAREFAVYYDGQPFKQETLKIAPHAELPAAVIIGSMPSKNQHFVGQVRSLWLGNQDAFTPPATVATASKTDTKPKTAAPKTNDGYQLARDRQGAEWVIGLGGKVGIVEPGAVKEVVVDRVENLPQQPFMLIRIDLFKNQRITADELEHLEGLTNLTTLRLEATPLDDAGLVHVGKLTSLKRLEISSTKVTGAGMEHLRALKNLDTFVMGNCLSLTDPGLEAIASLGNLTMLLIPNSRITGAGLASLKACPRLQNLRINLCPITDAGLDHLAVLTQLRDLDLAGTQLTDDGLQKLAAMPGLTHINLRNLNLSDAAVHGLQVALPNCKIDR